MKEHGPTGCCMGRGEKRTERHLCIDLPEGILGMGLDGIIERPHARYSHTVSTSFVPHSCQRLSLQ